MQRILPVFVLFSLLSLHSCKKPAIWTPGKFTGCHISRITEVPADTSSYSNVRTVYNFYYNDNGTVHHMYVFMPQQPYSSYYKYFTYGNGFIATKTANAQQNYTNIGDSLFLDGQNRVSRIPRGYYPYYSYSAPEADSFFYDSLGQMYIHTLNNYGTYFADTLVWQNGDVVTDTKYQGGSGSGLRYIYNYTYTDTLFNTGNITADLKGFENYGRSIYTSKHLLRETYVHDVYGGYDTVKTYSYILDAGGRVTDISETINGGGVNTTKVVYECR